MRPLGRSSGLGAIVNQKCVWQINNGEIGSSFGKKRSKPTQRQSIQMSTARRGRRQHGFILIQFLFANIRSLRSSGKATSALCYTISGRS